VNSREAARDEKGRRREPRRRGALGRVRGRNSKVDGAFARLPS